MKIQILNNDNGSGLNTMLDVYSDYNPQNKTFNRLLCKIEQDNFLKCFDDGKQDEIFNQMTNGKTIFNVKKYDLFTFCKTWY